MYLQNPKQTAEKGFSLLELLLVIVLASVIAALTYTKFRPQLDSGAAERTLETVAEKIAMRRDEAIRLNGLAAATSLETDTAPLVEIDFKDLPTTASLIINGDDLDHDNYDDDTNQRLTSLSGNRWKYSFRGDALSLPTFWHFSAKGELSVPLIGGGRGRGNPVTRIGFDAAGRAYGDSGDGEWQKFPQDSSSDQQSAPFWAVYLESNGAKKNQTLAIAVAVYPSGQIEKFRFDGAAWRGWRGRAVE